MGADKKQNARGQHDAAECERHHHRPARLAVARLEGVEVGSAVDRVVVGAVRGRAAEVGEVPDVVAYGLLLLGGVPEEEDKRSPEQQGGVTVTGCPRLIFEISGS